MVEIKNLSFSYPTSKEIFSSFSLKAEDGARICLFAKSGAGKTTLLRLVAGLEKPTDGSITLPQNSKISFCPQYSDLFERLTALQNVSLVCEKEKAEEILSLYGLSQSLGTKPAQLSAGMKKRVSLARAVCYDPDILLIDEGFDGLDKELRQVIADDLIERFKNKIIIFSTHDESDIMLLKAQKLEF